MMGYYQRGTSGVNEEKWLERENNFSGASLFILFHVFIIHMYHLMR